MEIKVQIEKENKSPNKNWKKLIGESKKKSFLRQRRKIAVKNQLGFRNIQEKLEKRLVFKACGLHSLFDLDLLSLYEPLLDMGTFTPFWTFR